MCQTYYIIYYNGQKGLLTSQGNFKVNKTTYKRRRLQLL